MQMLKQFPIEIRDLGRQVVFSCIKRFSKSMTRKIQQSLYRAPFAVAITHCGVTYTYTISWITVQETLPCR
jgi:hypothetical protein